MRAFIVKFAGLALHIYELQPGTLAMRHERPGKQPWEYILTEQDFEDSAEIMEAEALAMPETSLLASAVGLQIRLIKNEGHLKLAFTGENGGQAEWHFNDMEVVDGGRITACVLTQTDVDPSACPTCGADRMNNLTTVDFGTQTRTNHVTSSSAQTHALHESTSSANNSCSTTLDKQENPLKRKAQELPHDQPLLDKRAKSSHNSAQWPRHLYITCFRSFPIFKGDVGTMHIDVEEGTLWFEGWYGKPHMRVFERKQVDLRDENTRVAYCLNRICFMTGQRVLGVDGATHSISISRLNAKEESIRLFVADCSAPGWKMWGSNTDTNAKEGKIPITDPTIIIDAIVHCIDRASGRTAVHDPDRDDTLRARCKEVDRTVNRGYVRQRVLGTIAKRLLRQSDQRRERLRCVELE